MNLSVKTKKVCLPNIFLHRKKNECYTFFEMVIRSSQVISIMRRYANSNTMNGFVTLSTIYFYSALLVCCFFFSSLTFFGGFFSLIDMMIISFFFFPHPN